MVYMAWDLRGRAGVCRMSQSDVWKVVSEAFVSFLWCKLKFPCVEALIIQSYD